MKHLLFYLSSLYSLELAAQLPEDALRMSWNTPSGTARQQAIGGAMCSLGGEISTSYVNPAGLGFYKTSEFVLSPGLGFQTDKSNYRGTNTTGENVFNFNLGTSGFVYGLEGENGSSAAFSIAVNQTANFNGNTYYTGQNNYSSFSEQYAEEFVNSGLSINDGINSPQLSYGTRMALYSYLIDTATIGSSLQVIGMPQKILAANGSLNQSYNRKTKGGITEIVIALGASTKEKWCFGASLGIPIVSYTRTLSFTESDASGNTNNDFSSSTYSETYTSKGGGINLRLGAIYKAGKALRLGLSVQTPTVYSMTDNTSASMTTNTENYAGVKTINSADLDQSIAFNAGDLKYDFISPWKFTTGFSYLLGSVENVKNQKGFITADIEYVTTKSPRFNQPEVDDTNIDGSYFNGLNNATKNYYKNNFNFRLGTEFKLNILALRAGVAYYSDPYSDKELKADRLYLSGGVGYRNKGIFIDLTYIQGFTRDVNFPYRLVGKANTYASVKQSSGTVLVTVGFKF
jgi:hypothetical protein